jgi:uncharacterized SAM-binding protein YcdF (DUF218 family)
MFFILSKLLSFLLSPFSWLLLFILLAFFIRNVKWKKRFKWTAFYWFLFFSNPYIIHQLSLKWQASGKELRPGENYEAGIVLGGFVQFNKNENKGYFSAASDRFLQAVRLYKLGHIKKILISGGSGSPGRQDYKDADFAREQLLQFGVPDSAILTERNSRNTFESAQLSKKVLDSARIHSPVLLITSAIHMKRAESVFVNAGFSVVAYPAHFTEMNFPLGFPGAIIPSLGAINSWKDLLKEVVGLQVYKWTDKA